MVGLILSAMCVAISGVIYAGEQRMKYIDNVRKDPNNTPPQYWDNTYELRQAINEHNKDIELNEKIKKIHNDLFRQYVERGQEVMIISQSYYGDNIPQKEKYFSVITLDECLNDSPEPYRRSLHLPDYNDFMSYMNHVDNGGFYLGGNQHSYVGGIHGKDICGIRRYAPLGDRNYLSRADDEMTRFKDENGNFSLSVTDIRDIVYKKMEFIVRDVIRQGGVFFYNGGEWGFSREYKHKKV